MSTISYLRIPCFFRRILDLLINGNSSLISILCKWCYNSENYRTRIVLQKTVEYRKLLKIHDIFYEKIYQNECLIRYCSDLKYFCASFYLNDIKKTIKFSLECFIFPKKHSFRCSSRWFHLCDWTCRSWQSRNILNRTCICISFTELSIGNIIRRNHIFWWKNSIIGIILLCTSGTM